MTQQLVALALILGLVFTAGPVAAGDWLHFGADSVYSGHARGETVISPDTVGDLERRWGLSCDDGYFFVISRSPAIRDGTLYTSGAGARLTAYDAATGEELWQFGQGNYGWAPPPTVTANGAVLYLEGSYPTELYAVDGATGAELWQAPLGFDLGYTNSALVTVDEDRELVYLVEEPFAPGAGKLWALELATGEVAWYLGPATDGMGFKGDYPLLHGSDLYVVAEVDEEYWQRDRAVVVDPDTRQVAAEFIRPADLELHDISALSTCGGRLLVNYCDRDDVFESEGVLVAYDLATRAEAWRHELPNALTGKVACNDALGVAYVPSEPYLDALEVGAGARLWRYTGYSPILSPSLANGVVFFMSDTNMYAVDEATGDRLLRFPLGAEVYPTNQVAIADGMAYFSGYAGTCDLFALGLAGGGPADGADGVIPAAASNAGAGGTFWGTTVWAFQDAADSATLILRAGNEALPAGQVAPVEVAVPRGRVVRVDDVLARFPQVAPPAAVLYRWEGVEPDRAVVASRTFTSAPGGGAGTLGQGIPGIDLEALPAAAASQVVPLSVDESRVRSNLGVANAGDAATEVRVRVRSASGAVLGEMRCTLAAGAWRQLNRVLDLVGVTTAPGLYAEVSAEGPAGARLAVYASLVDNATGDPTYMAAQQPPSSGELLVPVAAHNPGQAGTQWVTDLALVNWSGGDGMACDVDLLAEGLANHPAPFASTTFQLGALDQLVLPDVILSVFRESRRKGALAIQASGTAVWSRTYNAGDQGTYGQGMPGLAVSEHRLAGGDRGYLVGLEESGAFRTNLGLVNTSIQSCAVTVELYSASGARLATVARTLPPRGMEQLAAPFAAVGGVVDGRVVVTSDHGVVAYASVVDNATGDATTVLARKIR